MRKPTSLDWVGGFLLWTVVTLTAGIGLGQVGMPEQVGVPLVFFTWVSGIVAARIWWLKRPEPDPDPELDPARHRLTARAKIGQRLDEIEERLTEFDRLHLRLAELEERLDFSERLLAGRSDRDSIRRSDA